MGGDGGLTRPSPDRYRQIEYENRVLLEVSALDSVVYVCGGSGHGRRRFAVPPRC
jgi:hypothetical protein